MSDTAIELFHQDGRPSGIWYCSECRAVSNDERTARSCHGTTHCETCGVELGKRQPYYRTQCDDCSNKAWREKQEKEEFARYTKAVKIAAADYTGPQVFFNDKYYETVEDFLDAYAGDDLPEYIWSAKNTGLRKASLEDVIDRTLEDAWEDADVDDLNGVEELGAAIDAFNEANASIPVYMVDYNEAIVLDESVLAEWKAEQKQ